MVGLYDWHLFDEPDWNLVLAPCGLGPRGEEIDEEIVVRYEYATCPRAQTYSRGRERKRTIGEWNG